MKKFERDAKTARILSAFSFGVATCIFLCLGSTGLYDRARLILAVLGYAGYLWSIFSYHRLGEMHGIDGTVDMLLDMGIVAMDRWPRKKREAAQHSPDEKAQGMSGRGNGG